MLLATKWFDISENEKEIIYSDSLVGKYAHSIAGDVRYHDKEINRESFLRALRDKHMLRPATAAEVELI